MTVWKRMLVIVVLACVVMACIPASASAVDPVMTTAMANAFAQAVAAYGASQGVSITFDVADTDGIGEGIHELWNEFKTQTQDQDVETFDSYAVTLFYNLFKKSSGGGNNNNNGDDKVAIAISAATVAALDKFWNWLLSGPAEMEKVDNQYYEWSLNSDNEVDPINVYTMDLFLQLPITSDSASDVRAGGIVGFTLYGNNRYYSSSVSGSYICFVKLDNMTTKFLVYVLSNQNGGYVYACSPSSRYPSVNTISFALSPSPPSGVYGVQVESATLDSTDLVNSRIPYFDTLNDAYTSFTDSDRVEQLKVRPYVYDPIVQPVTIPDPDDPDYDPQDLILPLNVPWDVTQFGDGESPMDDSQAEAAADAVGNSILTAPDNAIELDPDNETPPTDGPGEVYIPFLPVTLPSFNFNFSGIWHYVVDWIGSLGAWFSMVLTVWSNLPYAMTVPVYACLVILIVLGVYRRFLS